MRITNRLMGAELEYLASTEDKDFKYVHEYYAGMREVNSILLPASDVRESLSILKDILVSMQKKISSPLGTSGWRNSYGYAYNGVHLHLSGALNQSILEVNIMKLIGKYGLSPRTVSSWHVFNRPSKFSFKQRRKHCPVFKTSRGTQEIRVLDVEYFLDDGILDDLALAIDGAYASKVVSYGDDSWAKTLLNIGLEEYEKCCDLLDTNMFKSWSKVANGVYTNTVTSYTVDFTYFGEWGNPETMEEDDDARYTDEDREEDDDAGYTGVQYIRSAQSTVEHLRAGLRGTSSVSASNPFTSFRGLTGIGEGNSDA